MIRYCQFVEDATRRVPVICGQAIHKDSPYLYCPGHVRRYRQAQTDARLGRRTS